MLAQIVEGWSRESYEAAILDGVDKAAYLTSSMKNAQVSLTDLTYEDEKGFCAELEISTEALGRHQDMDLSDAFEITEPGASERFRRMQKQERERFIQMIANHFARLGQFNINFYIPDFILIPLGGAEIDNNVIETEFSQAVNFAKKQRNDARAEVLKKTSKPGDELDPD